VDNCSTIVELLEYRASSQSQQTAFTFLEDGERETERLTYAELNRRSKAISSRLQALNLRGERALLLYPSGLDYLAAFFGCLYAGVIAVPAYPPQNQRNTPRIQAIAIDAEAKIALTTETLLPRMQSLLGTIGNLQWLATDSLATGIEANWRKPDLAQDAMPSASSAIAFLQYTSGSTGTPKGVIVSHGNILHNAAMTYRCMGHSPKSKFVSWLPIYHDMGLIGGILQPFYGGFPCVLMSPTAFLQRPYRWLQAISRYRGTTSGAPNFAYELCVQKITAEQRATLDLSSWQVAFNGAEPIRNETLELFAATFADCGFRREAFYPCYGMAETTLLVSGKDKELKDEEVSYQTKTVDRLALTEDRIVEVFAREDSKILVGCGRSIPNLEIAIAAPETFMRCEHSCVGEIWVRGDSIAQGYWNRTEETEETFRASLAGSTEDSFLRTGDLGFLDDSGELFVTGRLKDLIIIRGRNLYPQDIELTAERSHDALRLGSNAAFTVEVNNEERLVVVQELEFRAKPNLEEVITAIRQAITETHEIEVYCVVLIKPGSISKTSSGKIQRRATRDRFLEDTLKIVASSILETKEFVDREQKLTREELLQQSPQESQLLLEAYLQTKIARILQRLPSEVSFELPLTSLGLDSLKVFELKNQLENDLEVDIAIADLFSGLNMRSLSTKILAQVETSNDIESISLERITTNNNIHPVSFAQARLWFLDRLKTGNPAYNISFAVRIEGRLKVKSLADSINEVISRQEILRTYFSTVDGKPVQVIHPHLKVALSVVDVLDSEVQEITTREHQRPFDLTQIPLLRLKLLRLNSEEHILLLAMHHIVADGLSAGVFMTEVAQHYQGLAVSDLPIQYKDVVYWQRQWLEGDSNRNLDYWKDKLKNAPPLLQLPTDKSRPPVQSYYGKSQSWEISANLTKQLQSLAQSEGVTLYMLLLAAFKTLLYRYTGQEDILVGSPIANRNHEKLKGLIGFFVNTLVLRSNLAGNPSFSKLLSQIRQVALEAYAHQDLPFDKLVEALQPARDLSYTPLFQVMFALQDAPQLATISGLTLSEYKVNSQIAQFDLSVCIENRDKTLIATFEYNTDLFDDATITRMVSHYQNLLEGIVINPEARLSDLPLLSNKERQQLLIDWNPPLVDLAQDISLQQLFAIQVEKNPHAIAVVDRDQQLTYQELSDLANQLANYLQSIEVKPEVLVGVYLERSLETIVAILGIIKAGAAYLPLDPEYPHERITWMLEDAKPLVILSQKYLQKQLPNHSAMVVCLDSEWNKVTCKDELQHKATKDNAVYTIYTSGSTGKPKGVVCTYGGLVNTYLAWQEANLLPDSDANCYLQMASFSFDVFTGDVIKTLCSGAKLVICPQELLLEPKKLYQFMVQEKVTCADFVPAVLMNLVEYLERIEQSLELIKLLIVGSDSWYVRDYQRVKKLCSLNTKLINAYGVTEATIDSTYFESDRLYLSRDRLVPIGCPFPNTQIYLLDNNLQLVPIGVWGQIYLGGVSLARGYLNNSELTAEKFISNPFLPVGKKACSPLPNNKLYKTGDKARYLPDGNIEFLERIDNQVKIRGFRIELTEIEIAINQYKNINQGIVVVQKDIADNKKLIAYIVLKGLESNQNIELITQQLKTYLKGHLPDYMIPADWQVLKELPLTANGKIDRKLLANTRWLDSNHLTKSKQIFTPAIIPNNKQEQIIAEIWQEILQRENISVNDNFFDVGGHSLLLAQMQEKLEQSLQIKLAITDLFKYPSISSLANHLSHKENNLLTNSDQPEQFLSRTDKQKAAFARKKQLKKGNK
jgi:amino acid adenylation domain-containing protein